jgi:hypothetical protein
MSHVPPALSRATIPGFIITLLLTAVSYAGEAQPLFADDDVLAITLVAPLRDIFRDESDRQYPGTIELVGSDGEPVTLDVKVRARGNFRRENCDFPPLRLNLRKEQVEGTVFEGQDKMPLVSHCRDRSAYTQYLLKEYLAYRILNILTDSSYRVRLFDIRYVDSDKPDRAENHYAFVVEHHNAMAERLGVERVAVKKADRNQFDRSYAALALVFQYLIGNTDFSFVLGPDGEDCCHNAQLVRRPDGAYLPIPYDFDYSGFVDPPYAVPPKQLKLRNIRERVYRGPCDERSDMDAAFARLQEQRDTIYALIREQPGLEERTRNDLVRYVDDFYQVLDNPDYRQREFFARCD